MQDIYTKIENLCCSLRLRFGSLCYLENVLCYFLSTHSLTFPTQPTAHTRVRRAAQSESSYLSDKLRSVYINVYQLWRVCQDNVEHGL